METGSDITATAFSNAGILSFVGGIAVSGGVSGNLSDTINDVHNTVTRPSRMTAHTFHGQCGRPFRLDFGRRLGQRRRHLDDRFHRHRPFGLRLRRIGAATAYNHVRYNTVEATIANSTVTSGGATDVTATSSGDHPQPGGRYLRRGRRRRAGLSHGQSDRQHDGGVRSASSTVTAGGEVLVKAADTAPVSVPDYLSAMDDPGRH